MSKLQEPILKSAEEEETCSQAILMPGEETNCRIYTESWSYALAFLWNPRMKTTTKLPPSRFDEKVSSSHAPRSVVCAGPLAKWV